MAASSFPAAFSALRRKRPGALSSVASRILSWVVQDENDGTPNHEEIWHFDYGTSGQTSNRLTAIYNPSACSDYDESTYAVTLRTSAGLIYAVEYFTTQGLGYYAGYPKKIRIKQGTSGTLDTLIEYGRTITARPDGRKPASTAPMTATSPVRSNDVESADNHRDRARLAGQWGAHARPDRAPPGFRPFG